MIINSIQTQNNQIYSGTFELEELKNGGEEVIKDERVINETIAEQIARAEFLENGYINQVVEFTTDFSDLKINDIISIYAPTYRIPRELNKDRFIVKRIEHFFQDGYIKSRIKAVRYDI